MPRPRRLDPAWWDAGNRRAVLIDGWRAGRRVADIASDLGISIEQLAREARRLRQAGRLGSHKAANQGRGGDYGGTNRGPRAIGGDVAWHRYVARVWTEHAAELARAGIRYEDAPLRPFGSGLRCLTTSTAIATGTVTGTGTNQWRGA